MIKVLERRRFDELPDIHIGEFHGALDRLILLVRSGEIPVRKIWLSEVAAQVLGQVEELQIAAGGEAILLVATLIKLKTRAMLKDLTGQEVADLVEETEQRRELLDALEEARAVAVQIQATETKRYRPRDSAPTYRADSDVEDGAPGEEITADAAVGAGEDLSLDHLGKLFAAGAAALSVPDPMTMAEAAEAIMAELQTKGRVPLGSATDDLPRFICFFLAALELLRLRLIRLRQEAPFSEVWLELPAIPPPATKGEE